MNVAFGAFSLLMTAGFIGSGLFRNRIGSVRDYQKALVQFVVALILYFPVSELVGIGAVLSYVSIPVGFVVGVISLRTLCLALIKQ